MVHIELSRKVNTPIPSGTKELLTTLLEHTGMALNGTTFTFVIVSRSKGTSHRGRKRIELLRQEERNILLRIQPGDNNTCCELVLMTPHGKDPTTLYTQLAYAVETIQNMPTGKFQVAPVANPPSPSTVVELPGAFDDPDVLTRACRAFADAFGRGAVETRKVAALLQRTFSWESRKPMHVIRVFSRLAGKPKTSLFTRDGTRRSGYLYRITDLGYARAYSENAASGTDSASKNPTKSEPSVIEKDDTPDDASPADVIPPADPPSIDPPHDERTDEPEPRTLVELTIKHAKVSRQLAKLLKPYVDLKTERSKLLATLNDLSDSIDRELTTQMSTPKLGSDIVTKTERLQQACDQLKESSARFAELEQSHNALEVTQRDLALQIRTVMTTMISAVNK